MNEQNRQPDEGTQDELDPSTPSCGEGDDGGNRQTDTPKQTKKKRQPYVDDGHTVYDMSGLEDPRERAARKNRVSLTRGERWAVIRAAFMRFAPPMLITILGFLAAMLLIRLWLHA